MQIFQLGLLVLILLFTSSRGFFLLGKSYNSFRNLAQNIREMTRFKQLRLIICRYCAYQQITSKHWNNQMKMLNYLSSQNCLNVSRLMLTLAVTLTWYRSWSKLCVRHFVVLEIISQRSFCHWFWLQTFYFLPAVIVI